MCFSGIFNAGPCRRKSPDSMRGISGMPLYSSPACSGLGAARCGLYVASWTLLVAHSRCTVHRAPCALLGRGRWAAGAAGRDVPARARHLPPRHQGRESGKCNVEPAYTIAAAVPLVPFCRWCGHRRYESHKSAARRYRQSHPHVGCTGVACLRAPPRGYPGIASEGA